MRQKACHAPSLSWPCARRCRDFQWQLAAADSTTPPPLFARKILSLSLFLSVSVLLYLLLSLSLSLSLSFSLSLSPSLCLSLSPSPSVFLSLMLSFFLCLGRPGQDRVS